MYTIVVKNVPDAHMRALREEAHERNISVNDLLLEMIKEHVEWCRRMKALQEVS
jgi:predicted HicB family RNase H-like nuclease